MIRLLQQLLGLNGDSLNFFETGSSCQFDGAGSYVSYNTHSGGGRNKILYKVSGSTEHVTIELIVNPNCAPFREALETRYDEVSNGDAGDNGYFWFERTPRDAGIFKRLDLNVINLDDVVDELNYLYNTYDITLRRSIVADARNFFPVALNPRRNDAEYDLTNVHWSWNAYLDFWDEFVRAWFDSAANPADPLTQSLSDEFRDRNEDFRLLRQELPEPYYGLRWTEAGDPAFKGVLVNLNPGASQAGETSKMYGGNGDLIEFFEHNSMRTYSRYALERSPLDDGADRICGFPWWHEVPRMNWLNRFFHIGDAPASILALEACPYHSVSWGNHRMNPYFERHVVEKVVFPAAVAASLTERRCAVFVGSQFAKLIPKIRGCELVGAWKGTRIYILCRFNLSVNGVAPSDVFLLFINGVQRMYLPGDNELNRSVEDEIDRIISASNAQQI